jgi:parallel beta-helix repeat protein
MRRSTLLIPAAAILAAAAIFSYAGPLNPPGGPMSPTYKTLSEVEPRIAINGTNTPPGVDSLFRITQPGSYYLTGNISGVGAKHGIEIAASGVTIDLMGFALTGVPGSLDGITVAASNLSRIAVRNGTVSGWGVNGVDLYDLNLYGCSVTDVHAGGNGGLGIGVGRACTVSGCTAYSNTGSGIVAVDACAITGCSASFNNYGFEIGAGAAVSGCAAFLNNLAGMRGGAGNVITNCTSRGNGTDGIIMSSANLIQGNTCTSNGVNSSSGAGIRVQNGDNRIEGNNCAIGDIGIAADSAGNIIIRNSCSGHVTDWVIAANNVFGPIIDRRAPASAAVSGFSAASSLGTTDPTANFSY